MQEHLGALAGEDEAIAESGSAVGLVGQVDRLQRGSEVGDDTGHTKVESLLGDVLEAEGVLDHFLWSPKRLHQSMIIIIDDREGIIRI